MASGGFPCQIARSPSKLPFPWSLVPTLRSKPRYVNHDVYKAHDPSSCRT